MHVKMIFQFWIRLKNEPLRGGCAVLDPNPKLKPFVNMQQSPNPQARYARAMRAQVFRGIPPVTQAGHKSCTSLLNPSLKPLINPRFCLLIVFKFLKSKKDYFFAFIFLLQIYFYFCARKKRKVFSKPSAFSF